MQENIDWNKLARYLAGECSDEERQEIDNWIASDPQAKVTMAALLEIWDMAAQKPSRWEIDKAWSELSSKAQSQGLPIPEMTVLETTETVRKTRHPHPFGFMFRAAAMVVVFLGITYLIIQFIDSREPVDKKPSIREITADKGQRINFEFDDGTKVTLNAGSSLFFPDHFSHKRREVTLKGEALFRVARINGIPFIVNAEGAAVEVLGTQFSVKAWPGEKSVQVVVADGRVEFRAHSGTTTKSVILTRGQMSSLSETGELTPPVQVDADRELAWASGLLLFDKTPFREAVKSIERRYNYVCVTPDTVILSRRLTATFKDESQNVVLDMISLSLDLRYSRSQDTVVFRDNSRRGHTR